MAEEMKGTNISSPVVPFTKDDKYATHDETFGRGGYRSVNSISEMNAIPSERRKEGMLVNVIGDKIYKLTNGSFVDAGLGSGEVYVTSLELEKIYDNDILTQAQHSELVAIYNKWKAGVPVIMKGLKYNGILNIYTNNTTFNNQTFISITLLGLEVIREWHVKMTIGSLWYLIFAKGSIPLNFSDIPLSDGFSDTTLDGDNLYDSFKTFELNRNGNNPMYVTGIDGWSEVNIPIESSGMDRRFYITFYEKKYLIEYEINIDDITFSVSDITKYDLSIEVKTDYNGIYYRIKGAVPNGYIQFVKKKKHKYNPSGIGQINRTGYSVVGLYFNNLPGVKAISLTPNVWYRFPITKEMLYSKYTQGSQIEGLGGAVRSSDTIRLCGNIHANPITYTNGISDKSRRTSVLHAGLQYNVLHPDFVNGVSPKIIFKQRGEIVPIDVRMTVDPTDFNLKPFLYFAVQ